MKNLLFRIIISIQLESMVATFTWRMKKNQQNIKSMRDGDGDGDVDLQNQTI